MVVVSRYDTGGDESDILRNKMGITDIKELEYTEAVLLRDAYDHFFELLRTRKLKLDLGSLFEIHKYFLGTLYTWAGKVRTVNISKNNAIFAPAKHIEIALKQFELDFESNRPNQEDSKQNAAKKLAFLHCELNVIHPFREGNGRTLRLFLDLLGLDAGYMPVKFTTIEDEIYLEACRRGMIQDYRQMEELYSSLLEKTTKK